MTRRIADHPEPYETLDPDDWDALRELGRRMVDDMFDYLRTQRDRPAWRPVPESVDRSFREPLPTLGIGAEAAYGEFTERVLPYNYGNVHPRFWGWVNGTGSPLAMLAEMLASAMNPNLATFDQAGTRVERQCLAWLEEALGFARGGSGILVSGGSEANFLGLAVARHDRAGFDVRQEGLAGNPQLTVYASSETHYSITKTVEQLGIGHRYLRWIDTLPDYTIDLGQLAAAIRADRAEGLQPIAVIGNAGTVNTGAIDDLDALADLCLEENLWLHVDGAFGALAALAPELRPLLAGLERADSLAFDLHKWMYMPFEAGCLLVRDREKHRATFKVRAAHSRGTSYLQTISGGVTAGPIQFKDYGMQLTRGFRALKVWMSMKAEGVDKFGRLVVQNVEQARRLAERVEAEPELELTAPVPLNVVCFRYRPADADPERLNRLNERLLVEIQERGIAVPSSTVLGGRFCLRLAITNHRTRFADLDLLVDEAIRIGRELEARERVPA